MDTSKIIRGVVSNGRYTVTAPIVKEDYGLYLKIEGVELPSTYEVDFSNSENSGTSVTMIGNADGVLIPRQFIDTGKDIFAFLYHVGANYGRTVYKFRIPNKVRPDRTNEEPTPEEQSVIDQAIGALNTAVAQTAQDKADADASAQSASADAERAEEARTDAQNYATQAEQSATNAHESASQASTSATASANSASQSAQIKADVEDLAEDAQGYAQTSAQSAQASANSASQAQGYAQSASASAQSASGYASSAQTSANTASAKAQDASQSATTASQKATEASQSATNASQSAQTAEQAKTDAQTAQGLAESARDSAISAKNDAESAKDDAESARDEAVTAKNAIQESADQIAQNTDDVSDLKEGLNDFSKLATGYNLIDPSTIVDGELWNGATTSSGSYSRTPLVAVKPNTAYTFANTEFNYWRTSQVRARTIVFFTADGTYISRVDNTGNFTTPENCAYVGVSFYQNARKVILIEGTYDITTQTMVYIPYVADALKVNADSIDGLSVDNISDYKVTGKNLFDKTKAVSGFLKQYPEVQANEITYTSDYIPVKANVSYIIWHDYIESTDFSLRSYVLYDVLHQKVTGETGDKKNFVITPTVDGYLRFSGYNVHIDRTQVEVGTVPTTYEPYKEVFPNKALLNDSQLAQVNNILYGKKWVVLGDSFSNSGGTGTKISDGKYKGRNYTYPWIIGNRNNMEIVRFFEGGRTLAFPANPSEFTNSITCPTSKAYYQNIPEDADYITIYLGINDEHHATGGGDGEDSTGNIPLGTITDSDTSTYYGAWNVVLTWLITNRPNAHIGIIVTNGLTIEAYRTAQIEIARKYGIPFIDMNGDDRTPAMLRTVNPNIATSVKQALVTKWAVDPSTNTHPNDAAHLFESTFIENFLRSI